MFCKYCRSMHLVKRRNGPHIGIYCVACGKWQQWVKSGSPKEREVPWAQTGDLPECVIVDDPIAGRELSPELKKVMTENKIYLPAEAPEELTKALEALYQARLQGNTAAKQTLNSLYGKKAMPSDKDNTPPWED